MPDLPDHNLNVVLVRPQIPQNTGNVARTCLVTGCGLHLVRPLGFTLDDRKLKRSGLDYWPRLNPTMHAGLAAYDEAASSCCRWWFDSTGTRSLFDVDFQPGDHLVFGSETHGLPRDRMAADPGHAIAIPQVQGERCLNLATSVGVAVYAALRQIARTQAAP